MCKYYEKCENNTMLTYAFFLDKLKLLQKIIKRTQYNKLNNNIICDKCHTNILYQLGNIIWYDNIIHKIKKHGKYPSNYFIEIIVNTYHYNQQIINPPIILKNNLIKNFKYIPLHYNKLLIIDALMQQGSHPRYFLPKNKTNVKQRYIYSEHSGVLSLNNDVIDNIIISTQSSRVDANDGDIFLPVNYDILNDYEFLFHTHPNASGYGNRIKDGILYEFPSANDIFNFVKYRNEGKAQASIIIAPEGTYVIRQIKYNKKHQLSVQVFDTLRKYTLKLEKIAIKNIYQDINKISDADFFHENISSNTKYINSYNKFLESYNLYIEYYPRQKVNGEWRLKPILLQYVNETNN
ncbi:hypothetical protein [Bandra megavirus]|uniref:Uncharacterized protein n=1 Tax=Bandra megavirus TaxID=2071566 RepID=A0A2K9V877_9VIRU|nr:hypothetical protein [Bandra megavirus]